MRDSGGTDVEFVAPNPGAFGATSDTDAAGSSLDDVRWNIDAPRTERGSRRVTVVAGLVLSAFLSGGVIAAAPWQGSDDATAVPPTTITAPAVIVTAPERIGTAFATEVVVGGVDLDSMQGLRLDPVPADFLVLAAQSDIDVTGDATPIEPLGWGEVWATPGASRTSGSWFSVLTLPFENEAGGSAAERVMVGDARGLLFGDGDGVLRLTADLGGDSGSVRWMSISSYGRSADGLIELAESLVFEGAGAQAADMRPTFARPELLVDHQLLSAVATDVDLVDGAFFSDDSLSSTWYRSEPAGDLIALQVLRPLATPNSINALAWSEVDLRTLGTTPRAHAGDGLVVGQRTYDNSVLTIGRWTIDDEQVAVITTLAPDAVLGLMSAVRTSDVNEWSAMVDRVAANRMAATDRNGVPNTIAAGEFTDGTAWSAAAWPDDVVYRVTVGVSRGEGRFDSADGAGIIIDTRSEGTVVMARDIPAAASALRITTTAGTNTIPLVAQAESDTRRVFAASAFDADGAFLVEIIASDNSVASSYASPRYTTGAGDT
jgi:hypothetical protein